MRDLARQSGGPERVARQHARGKLTALERLGLLQDEGTFNPYHAANAGYVDDTIEPRKTRAKIIAALAALRDKFSTAPAPKHGNIPM